MTEGSTQLYTQDSYLPFIRFFRVRGGGVDELKVNNIEITETHV